MSPDVFDVDGKTHYQFPAVALSSITNRVTGCVLSGAVGFGAWFATLRFAPIPSEIRPIVVAVRLRAKNETNPKSNQPTDAIDDAVETSPNSSTNHPSRRQLPAIALGAFIIYSILTVALSVVFFPSRPTEARSLARDVLRARRRLAARGVVLS